MQNNMKNKTNNSLIYAIEDRPPLKESIFAAFQHLLAIFVAYRMWSSVY